MSSLPTFSTNYSYDNVNRVSSASDTGGWSRSFHYDQYGNLWTTGASGTPISGLMPTANVYNGNNQITGNSYDGAGNLTGLGTYTLVYDAENRLTQATDAPSMGGGSVQYFYDAGGQRVMKQFAGGARTVYVYDALGQMAAEYSSAAADTVTPACGTCYLTTDHLGSTRLVTDADGNVVARHDYLPFGEEVPAGSAGRTGQWGAFDSVSQKFTGQERDSETGLDFFQARHFSNVLGRFLSADPGNAGADLSDPQTWNGYSYVRNNPLALVDPSGMDATDPGDDCFSDPTCGGGGWWNFPPIDFPWPTSTPIPPPPPQPSPTVIQNAGGVYGHGQEDSFAEAGGSQRSGPFINIQLADPFWILRLFAVPYIDPFDRNHRFFGTHYCGPGGGGNTTGRLDNACIAHDTCYADAGLSAGDNNRPRPAGKTAALQHCNQQFCDTLKQMPGLAPAAARDYFRIVPTDGAKCRP